MKLKVFGTVDNNGNIVCQCPFPDHDDNNPSASYNITKGVVYCFGCKRSASKKKLEEMGYEIDFITRETTSIPVKKDSADETGWRDMFNKALVMSDVGWLGGDTRLYYNPVLLYAKGRGIDEYVSNNLQIRFTTSSVLFPHYNADDKLIGVQERLINSPIRYKMHGKRAILWPSQDLDSNLFVASGSTLKIYLTEGVFGAIMLRQKGIPFAYSISGSNPNDARKVVNMLSYYVDTERIITVFDNDKAGLRAAKEFTKAGARALVGITADELTDQMYPLVKNAQGLTYSSFIKQVDYYG